KRECAIVLPSERSSIMVSFNDNVSSKERAQVQAAGVRYGPVLALILYSLLLGSAVVALGTRRFPGMLPPAFGIIAPSLFLVFLVAFVAYGLFLAGVKKSPASKAFFQIGAAAFSLPLLFPAEKSRYDAPVDDLEVLLTDDNPRVGVVTAEVIGYRAE